MEKQTSNLSTNNGGKVKLLCSYGGKIQPRPSDRQLSYIGGDTKILAVDRNVKFSEFATKLNSLCSKIDNSEVSIKYQLPGEDLDALVSLIDDEDVEHMMIEYDRMQTISAKPAKLRLFLFDISGPSVPAAKSVANDSGPGPGPGPNSNPDYLFGFDKEYKPSIGPPLDLLQIPGVVLPENYGSFARDGFGLKTEMTESHVTGSANYNGTVIGTPAPAVYRVPVVAHGAEFYTGQHAFGLVTGISNGNGEQSVYNFAPVIPPVLEQTSKGLKGE